MARPTKHQQWREAISKSVTKLTPEVVQKLKESFAIGCTVKEACFYSEISERTYYYWIKQNPVLLQEFERMKNKLPLRAKYNIAQAIERQGDIALSKWLLERTESPMYGEKVKIEHNNIPAQQDNSVYPEDEALRIEYREKLRENIRKRSREKEKQTIQS